MASVARSRLLELKKLQCELFSHTFNPTNQRLGNKVLRQRLRGPTVAAYYPRKSATVPDLLKNLKKKLDLDAWDDAEEDRLDNVMRAKLRGKGPPKKLKTKEEGKSMKKKKR